MTQYIDKSALVAEIKKRGYYAQTMSDNAINGSMRQFYDGMKQDCVDLLSFLNTIEVKEVDLEKEYKDFVEEDPVYNELVNGIVGKAIAKHFFELGLKASNPLTWNDMMIIHKCCKDAMNFNLYAWETAEGQQKIYEDVLKRFKAQKGE